MLFPVRSRKRLVVLRVYVLALGRRSGLMFCKKHISVWCFTGLSGERLTGERGRRAEKEADERQIMCHRQWVKLLVGSASSRVHNLPCSWITADWTFYRLGTSKCLKHGWKIRTWIRWKNIRVALTHEASQTYWSSSRWIRTYSTAS